MTDKCCLHVMQFLVIRACSASVMSATRDTLVSSVISVSTELATTACHATAPATRTYWSRTSVMQAQVVH